VVPGVDAPKRPVVRDVEVGRIRDRILPEDETEDVARVLRQPLELIGAHVEDHEGMGVIEVRQCLGLPYRIPESVEDRPQLAEWPTPPVYGGNGVGGLEETAARSCGHAELARRTRTAQTGDAAIAGFTPYLDLRAHLSRPVELVVVQGV